ncbi:MAG: PAS-domain containing protein [Xanthobacteraceae bacterium]|nr:PAS-domain containing protein [Xanthobacteraceae bacterium]
MPGSSRSTKLGGCSSPTRAPVAGLAALAVATPAWPAEAATLTGSLTLIPWHELAALALVLGIALFAVVSAALLLRTRAGAAAERATCRSEIDALRASAEEARMLLLSEPQVLIIWPVDRRDPDLIGDPAQLVPEDPPARIGAFETWLAPDAAAAINTAVSALRAEGQGFSKTVTTRHGRQIEATGRAVGGRAVLRLRDLSPLKQELSEAAAQKEKLQRELETVGSLIEALPSPVWARDKAGRLVFVNKAYARAVEAADAGAVVQGGIELFDAAAERATNGDGRARRAAMVGGHRRVLDVVAVPTPHGSAGIGIDATEVETLHRDVDRMVDAHRRTLDQLATAVAAFNAERRLTFYNAAYRGLWDLDPAFLDQGPSDSAVLDVLRSAHKLPEQRDFREWRRELHLAYEALEGKQQEWHLPDGRTLRVVTTPNPEGGVTYLFEDVTERLDLERRFDALIRVQGETLDNLGEAVAVFGSDGRLRLSNPAFARLWGLASDTFAEHPHIETVMQLCLRLGAETAWERLRRAVTALDDRAPVAGRMERQDGLILDCATVPLPDGGTLVTFIDVTASVNVERALVDRNQALVAAERLKQDFVQHMSYELRSPLTNIIGFSYFLGDPGIGPLNPRQREYLGYITSSTNALLAIVDNILDLATIEAGAMKLDVASFDIRDSMRAAAEGVQDRLAQDQIRLELRAAPDIGAFVADERRIRQVLFNLLSNAVGFSPKGGTVVLAAERRPDALVLSVTDQGPGIPPEMKDRVFDWFESHPLGSRHRGVGLGLSIVRSFIALHGGAVRIDSEVGRGTTVICELPVQASS